MSSTVLGYRKLAYARYPPTRRSRRTRRRPEAWEHASYKTCRSRSFRFSVLLSRIVEKFLRSPPVFRKSDGFGISRSSLCRRSLTARLDLNVTIPCARAPAHQVNSKTLSSCLVDVFRACCIKVYGGIRRLLFPNCSQLFSRAMSPGRINRSIYVVGMELR
jgi:hypothetical protein